MDKFFDEQKQKMQEEIAKLERFKTEKEEEEERRKLENLEFAKEHYGKLLEEMMGFSNINMEWVNNEVDDLWFSGDDATGEVIFVGGSYEKNIIDFNVQRHLRDILQSIKDIEYVRPSDYIECLERELKKKQFKGFSYELDDDLEENEIGGMFQCKKMNEKYGFSFHKDFRHTEFDLYEEEISIDDMDGYEFEKFCANLLINRGYENVFVTQGSGDQGLDIIAYKDGIKYGFQCKCYSSAVGNKAVQEVFAGKVFYQCHVGIVITNNYFTESAIALARQNGIVLWDRNKLLQMVSE